MIHKDDFHKGGIPRGNIPRRTFWVWYQNLEGRWREFLDFASQAVVDQVVIWFPFAYMEGMNRNWSWPPKYGIFGEFGREMVSYAHARGIKFICGFGVNGYDTAELILAVHPELQITIPDRLKNTEKGKASMRHMFCPSQEKSQHMVQELLTMLVEKTGVDGFNFESGAVDYVTCHCARCEAKFKNQGETEHGNKPILWDLEQINRFTDFLKKKGHGLSLSMDAIYGQVTDPEELARGLDAECTIIWADWSAFPDRKMAEKLMSIRKHTGFMLRLHTLREAKAEHLWAIISNCQELISLGAEEIVGRAWIPRGWNGIKMALFAGAIENPPRPRDEFQKTIERLYSIYPFDKAEDEVPRGDYNEIKGK